MPFLHCYMCYSYTVIQHRLCALEARHTNSLYNYDKMTESDLSMILFKVTLRVQSFADEPFNLFFMDSKSTLFEDFTILNLINNVIYHVTKHLGKLMFLFFFILYIILFFDVSFLKINLFILHPRECFPSILSFQSFLHTSLFQPLIHSPSFSV